MSDSTIDDIRDMSEENDLNTILKPTAMGGGYTKRSVMEYLSYLRRREQDAKDAYLQEALSLKEENQRLNKENAELNTDINEAVKRLSEDESRLKRYKTELNDLKISADELKKDADEYKSLYDTASAQNEELNRIISDLSGDAANQIIPLSCDTDIFANVDLPISNDKIDEFARLAEEMKAEFAKRADELADMAQAAGEQSSAQTEKYKEVIEKLQIALQTKTDQNELLENEKRELNAKVGKLLEENLALSGENIRLKAANAILQRRTEVRQ